MARKSKKPIEGELTLKALKSVVGGRALTPKERHQLQHHYHGHGAIRLFINAT
jgi:hypothetical protein